MKKEKRIIFILSALFFTGLLLHGLCITRKYALILTTPFLFIVSYIILNHVIRSQKHKILSIYFLVLVFVFTLIIEILGVKTGLIFGNYVYGKTLWFKLGHVPVVIGINWVVLILASENISVLLCDRLKIKPQVTKNIIAGVFLVMVDYYIEPVAMKLDYWQWENNTVPIRNYLSWFIVSQLVYYGKAFFKIKIEHNFLLFVYLVMLIYFILLKKVLIPCF